MRLPELRGSTATLRSSCFLRSEILQPMKMVNALKQILSSFPCTAAGICNGPSPRRHTKLSKRQGQVQLCTSKHHTLPLACQKTSSAVIKIPLGQREDFRTCASKDSYPPPTSSATWHPRLQNDRTTDWVRATVGPKMNLNGNMNHWI